MQRLRTAKGRGTIAVAAAILVFSAMAAAAVPKHRQTPEDGWVTYKNDELGYSLYYPSTFFEPQGIAAPGEAKTFLSPDQQAKIVVSAVKNDENFTLASYRSTLLSDYSGYEGLDYSPKGESWFVLSGYRGETIYYQKVMFSCDNRVINVFSMTFPTDDRAFYEGVIEVMEDNFHPGVGKDTPAGCR